MKTLPPPETRVEVLWHRGLADEWVSGTMLAGDQVQLDDPSRFVSEGPCILEAAEIADWRPI